MRTAWWTIALAASCLGPAGSRAQEAAEKGETWFLGDGEGLEDTPGGTSSAGGPESADDGPQAPAPQDGSASPAFPLPPDLDSGAASDPDDTAAQLLARCGPPSLADALAAAWAAAGLEPEAEDELLAQARWAAVLPRVRLTVRRDWEHDESLDVEPDPEDGSFGIDTDDDLELGVTAQWDLGAIVAPGSSTALRRLALEAQDARRALGRETAGAYFEWCRLRLEWGTAATDDRRAELVWAIAERVVRLDTLTGGFFRRALGEEGTAGREGTWTSAGTGGTR